MDTLLHFQGDQHFLNNPHVVLPFPPQKKKKKKEKVYTPENVFNIEFLVSQNNKKAPLFT